MPVNCLNSPPVRIALPDAPAPSSRVLEKAYYTKAEDLVETVKKILKNKTKRKNMTTKVPFLNTQGYGQIIEKSYYLL